MFVSWKVVSGKSLFKLFCFYLPLWKLVNGKHFPFTGKHFPVIGKHFSVNEKFGLVSRKVFFLLAVFCFPESGFREITFQTFLCLFAIRKVGQRKTLFSQRKIWLGFQESVFLKNLNGKYFLKVVRNLEMPLFADYIKFFIAIYNLFWIFIFQFHLLKFNFYINFDPYFYNCYLPFPYHFLLKFFIYQIWCSFFWLLLILFEIIYEILIIIILISSAFIFF